MNTGNVFYNPHAEGHELESEVHDTCRGCNALLQIRRYYADGAEELDMVNQPCHESCSE